MSDADKKMRMERIEWLLQELHYEVERGMMETEIDESIAYTFIVPVSRQIKNGVVHCAFNTRPVHRGSIIGHRLDLKPRLKVVK